MKDVFAAKISLIPAGVYDLVSNTLTGNVTEEGSYSYPDAGDPGDLVWLRLDETGQTISGDGIDPTGFDSRFNGLYIVLDPGSEEPNRHWKLRRALDLDTTEKYEQVRRVWMTHDSNNAKPSWSPYGTPFEIILPPHFQLNHTHGPILSLTSYDAGGSIM